MYRRAKAIGEEARGKGIHTQFGPGVNLMRTPQAGRAFECKLTSLVYGIVVKADLSRQWS